LSNKEIKFKAFLDFALSLGADFIATGHYAQRTDRENNVQMLKGKDNNKDQSYFLYTLGQNALKHSLFPLGKYQKPQVRDIAERLGFANYDKKDSTGICFIGERKFTEFLERYLPAQPGDIVNDAAEVIGRHNGLMFHTLGQRKGLGIGGLSHSTEDPWYVYGKDLENNTLLVCQGVDNRLMMTNQLSCSQLHWVDEQIPEISFPATCKVRYRQPDQDCFVTVSDGEAKVTFPELQRAVTPGQSVVFYKDDVCLGGGIIDSASLEN